MKTTNVLLEKGLQVAAQKVRCQKPYMFLGHTRNNKTTKPQIPKSPNFIVYADLFGKPCLGMALPSFTIGQLFPLFALSLGTKRPEELLTIAEESQRNLEIVNAGFTLSMLHRYNSNKDLWGLVIPAPGLPTIAYISLPPPSDSLLATFSILLCPYNYPIYR